VSSEKVMTRLSLEIELPDTLAQQAKEAGLLESDAVERMVREALLARRVESLAQARQVLAVDYLQGLRYRTQFIAAIDAIFDDVDVLAMPTTPVPAPLASEAESVMVLLARNCIPWSFGWYPTLNLPTGLTPQHLPVSIQFVGPRFSEGRLLALGSAYESATSFNYPEF